ncbi:MAG: sulfatase-like hydrolase/transferase [Bacteroides sp.]|nr:sulfatase-like hydrolase/transferase [Bacteroides sp.]
MKKTGILFILTLFGLLTSLNGQISGKPNILFIAVDDLKPLLGCYGDTLAHTPNIDALAASGLTFTGSYCQQAVCAPTRVSLMTSRYPDQTRVWDLQTQMRDMDPDIVTLPQYLIGKGYQTRGTGKIFDSRSVDKDKDKPSWSIAFRNAWDAKYYDPVAGKPVMYFYASQHAKDTIALLEAEAAALGVDRITYVKERYFPAIENAEVPYDAYADGAVANVGIELMEEAVAAGKPFFLGVGFSRPHLPFNAPKEYWDLYRREDFSLAPFREKAAGSPSLAYHNSDELRSYTGIPKDGALPEAQQLELIHAYYAATSYIDHLVGMVTGRLEELGVANNTIIVLWGDHGWHLGDHQLWCKHSNFEQATRTPLIIHYPGQPNPGAKCASPVEFTDIAPTLLDLVGLDIPGYFEGESLSGLISDTLATVREGSLSQYPRQGNMGYSLRTDRFRYTLWVSPEGTAVASELYDYQEDPNETINRVFYPEHEAEVKRLDSILLSRIECPSTQHKIRFRVQGEHMSGGFGPMEGVSVTMASESRPTGLDGELLFTHHKGLTSYRLELAGYKSLEDTLLISGDSIVNLEMELEDPIYDLDIKASDRYTGKALMNALVTVDDSTLRTSTEGEVLFRLIQGSYIISLKKDLYEDLVDTLYINADTSIHFRLAASIASIKIRLKENTSPVNNARVILGETEILSNNLGISMFEGLSTGETYLYELEKEGYLEKEGSIILHADTTVDIQMERITGLSKEEGGIEPSLWPNPAGDRLFFRANGPAGKKIELIDTSGKVFLTHEPVRSYEVLDIASLHPGSYLFHWETEKGSRYFKFLKN